MALDHIPTQGLVGSTTDLRDYRGRQAIQPMFSIQVEECASSSFEFLRIPDPFVEWKDRAYQKGIVRLLTKYPTRKNSTTQSWVCQEETILTRLGADGDFVVGIHFSKSDVHKS